MSSLQTTQFQQRKLMCWRQHNLLQRKLIRYRQHNFNSESWFAEDNTIFCSDFSIKYYFAADNRTLAANVDSLQTMFFQQRTRVRCRQHNISSECWFAANNTLSAVNTDSLQTTQFMAANASSLRTTQVHLVRFFEFIHSMFSLTLW
jgi:hypothetical protein